MRRLLVAIVAICLAAPCAAFWQSRDSNYNQNIVSSGGKGLQTNVAAMWEFENTSWTDSSGHSNTLTASATSPTVVASFNANVGNASSYVGTSSETLTATSNTGLQVGAGSYSISLWTNVAAANPCAGNSNCILSKADGGFNNREWALGTNFSGGNMFAFGVYINTISGSPQTCTTSTSIDGNWHHIVITWDGSSALKIYVDNGTPTSCTFTGPSQNSTSNVIVGKDGDSSTFMTGKVDQVVIWKGRVLNSSDVSNLFNSGAGLTWAEML